MNPLKGEVPLVLSDGRTFKLVLDMEALVEAEAAYGKPLRQLMVDAQAEYLGALGALLQGALSRHHRMSRREVLDLIGTDMEAVTDALNRAGETSSPKESAEGNAPARKRQAGKTSGGSGAKAA